MDESLEAIVADFTRSLIKNKLSRPVDYLRLQDRILAVIECEIRFRNDRDNNRNAMMGVMNAWESVNKPSFEETKELRGIEKATKRAERGNE